VRKKTPKSRSIVADNSVYWTNSFQLLARAEGLKEDDTKIRKSNEALQRILNDMEDPVPDLAIKGKGIMEEGDGDGMRGFSPHS